ncbi:MAG TPA: ribosome alternative rescue factor ArfA, partial [Pseudoalteromonas sp.]|nr:ribosome alternative rescue factor ArfA [Pseudoalteromonas sp.]
MAKKSKTKAGNKSAVDTGRGVIKHNALAALVTSKVF